MARPGTWKEDQLVKMYAEIKESGSTIKDYCTKNKIGYHKLYQAFRRNSIVGEYASATKAKATVVEVAEPTTSIV